MRVEAEAALPESRIAVRWIRATFLGWTLGFVLAIALVLLAEGVGLPALQFPLALGMGTGVGLVQARLVAPYLGARAPWILASALGLAAPFVLWDAAGLLGLNVRYSLAACVALGGLSAGLLQWRVLHAVSARAAWWIPASAAGWLLAASLVLVADRFVRPPAFAGLTGTLLYLLVLLAGGALLGVAGAPALRGILAARQR